MSQTIVIPNMYQTPAQQYQLQTGNPPPLIDAAQVEEHLVDFYEDVCTELSNFGDLEELHVCNNLGDHLMGNVYAKFYDEDGAADAQRALHGRFYAKRALICEFSPVTDFEKLVVGNLISANALVVVIAILCIYTKSHMRSRGNCLGMQEEGNQIPHQRGEVVVTGMAVIMNLMKGVLVIEDARDLLEGNANMILVVDIGPEKFHQVTGTRTDHPGTDHVNVALLQMFITPGNEKEKDLFLLLQQRSKY
eukprot:CAMPEP_0117023592 /NCGR_PEP_ID=MMETSP0472-20121206/17594_1 /TAXON_ID=693140 ORGANISM="Tiarina fusus, Strain LIS" /NCGR_SAMPLE_ID=MMETSP0472 /ASSEMBLY_ACC=CAM_ASM_000603 /LENGTH=248 /DNA_ID=CAMNT_0004729759 /DNA_START=131 /DNA_END=878 /DNA_ORIENTATION=-